MDILLSNEFETMSLNEMYSIDGGGWSDFFYALAGGICIAISPIIGTISGIASATVSAALPGVNIAVGVSAGVTTAASVANVGTYLLDKACGGY